MGLPSYPKLDLNFHPREKKKIPKSIRLDGKENHIWGDLLLPSILHTFQEIHNAIFRV